MSRLLFVITSHFNFVPGTYDIIPEHSEFRDKINRMKQRNKFCPAGYN